MIKGQKKKPYPYSLGGQDKGTQTATKANSFVLIIQQIRRDCYGKNSN